MMANKEMVDAWKKNFLSLGHSYPSMNTYYSFIKRFVGNEVEINQRNVNRFREFNTSSPAKASLKNFFEYLVNRKDFPEDILRVRFDKSISKHRFPKSISLDDIKLIINHMPSLKYKIFTLFLYQAGLRISEGLKVSWSDINFSDWLKNRDDFGKLVLKNTKRGKFRVTPINKDLMELLYSDDISKFKTESGIPYGRKNNLIFDFGIENYENKERSTEENQFDYIDYAKHAYRDVLYRISNDVLGYKISPHVFRHSRAQHLLDNNMTIDALKSFLGHASIVTTEIYAQASPEKIKRELKAFDLLTQDGMTLLQKPKEEVKKEEIPNDRATEEND